MVSIRDGMKLGGYEILRFIGKGGMGEIWLARQTSIGRDVALKILSPTLVLKNPRFAERFIAEAQAAGRLNHPHIIGVHDVGRVELDGELIHYFSMEYVDGENYRQILDRDGPIDVESIGKVMAAMADALGYAHALGMIHRDIKPENIMITRDGRVKLADFGLAMQVDSSEASEVERDDSGRIKVMGTPLYMSPEQARGRPLDFRSDLYSLGATLFHFLTGRPPYRRNSSKEVMRAHVHDEVPDPADVIDCSEAWRHLCMHLMAKAPSDRAQSPEDFRARVQEAIARQHEVPRRRRHPTAAGARHRKSPGGAFGAIAILALVLVIGLVVVLVLTRGSKSNDRVAVDPTDDPADDPATDRSARVAAARSFIAELPREPSAALAALSGSKGLRNAYFIAEPAAMDLLRAKQRSLRSTIAKADEDRQAELTTILQEAEQRLREGRLVEARTTLDGIGDDDRAPVRSRWNELDRRVERELDTRAQRAIDAIEASTTPDTIPPQVEQAKAEGLTGERLAAVESAAKARHAEIKQAAARQLSQKKAQLQQQFRELADLLEKDRRSAGSGGNQAPDYRAFLRHLSTYESHFEVDPDRRAAVATLREVGTMGEELHQALVTLLEQDPYPVTMPLSDVEARGHVTGFERGRFLIQVEWPKVLLHKAIDQDDVPLRGMLKSAAAKAQLDRVEERIAAFCWLWRLDQGKESLIDALRDSAMTAAIARVDDEIRQALDHIELRYAFAQPQQAWLEDFASERLSLEAGALRFAPQALMPFTVAEFERDPGGILAKMREQHLDTVTYAQPLAVPVRVEATLQLYPDSKALIGFAQDGKLVRLYLDYTNTRIAVMVTGNNDALGFGHAVKDRRVLGEIQLVLSIDDQGRPEYRVGGAVFGGLDDQRFDPAKPVRLVIQDLHLQGERVGAIDLRNLVISAQRPR